MSYKKVEMYVEIKNRKNSTPTLETATWEGVLCDTQTECEIAILWIAAITISNGNIIFFLRLYVCVSESKSFCVRTHNIGVTPHAEANHIPYVSSAHTHTKKNQGYLRCKHVTNYK